MPSIARQRSAMTAVRAADLEHRHRQQRHGPRVGAGDLVVGAELGDRADPTVGDPVDEAEAGAHSEHPEEAGGPAAAEADGTVSVAMHDHGDAAGGPDQPADHGEDGDEQQIVALGRDPVQVVGDGDAEDDQRTDQLTRGQLALLDLEQDDQDES